MFHVKQRRFVGLLLLGLMALGLGCLGREGPRGWAAPVRLGDIVIVSTDDGRLDGIDAEGRVVWRFPRLWAFDDGSADNLDGIYGKPVIASYDGEYVVFVGDYNGYVYAFRPGDFQPGVTVNNPSAASFELDGSVIGGLVLDTAADALYVTSGNRVYGLKASDIVRLIDSSNAAVAAVAPAPEGEQPGVLFRAGEDIWGAPVLADGKLLISSLDGGLYAIEPTSGAEIWHFEADRGLASTPVVAGDVVLVSGFGSKLYGVDLADGGQRWEYEANHWIWGQAAIDADIAYVGDFAGVVHAVNVTSGVASWSIELSQGSIRASPVISEGTLVVSTDDGWIGGIDLESQSVVWQHQIGTRLNADMTVEEDRVLIAPRSCVTPEGASDRVYYTSLNARNGDLSFTSEVC
jgi:outer membrane protein assembly factor BamB